MANVTGMLTTYNCCQTLKQRNILRNVVGHVAPSKYLNCHYQYPGMEHWPDKQSNLHGKFKGFEHYFRKIRQMSDGLSTLKNWHDEYLKKNLYRLLNLDTKVMLHFIVLNIRIQVEVISKVFIINWFNRYSFSAKLFRNCAYLLSQRNYLDWRISAILGRVCFITS